MFTQIMYNVNLLLFSLHFEGLKKKTKKKQHLEDSTNSDRRETIILMQVKYFSYRYNRIDGH